MIRIYLQFSIVHKVTKRLLRNLQLHCKFIPWQITTIWHGVSFAFVTKDLWNIPGCFAWFFLWGTLLLKRQCRSGHPQKRVHCKKSLRTIYLKKNHVPILPLHDIQFSRFEINGEVASKPVELRFLMIEDDHFWKMKKTSRVLKAVSRVWNLFIELLWYVQHRFLKIDKFLQWYRKKFEPHTQRLSIAHICECCSPVWSPGLEFFCFT